MTAPQQLLLARGVTHCYGGFRALSNVDLSLAQGELVSVVGPNGAGKTTLVHTLTGYLRPTHGSVEFLGRSIAGEDAVVLTARGLARSFQLVNVFPELTVQAALSVGAVSHLKIGNRLVSAIDRNQKVQEIVIQIAEAFGLVEVLEKTCNLLPHGKRKLLDVACAFTLHPRVILLDEPTAGVSSADKHSVMETLLAAAQRMGIGAILLIEHDMDLVRRYSSRIVAMRGPGKAGAAVMSLSVESLHATLAGNEVLRNVNLRVGAGELVCLVGRNGAGKTSAFRSIMGFIQPTQGRISWQARLLNGMQTHAIARLGLGYTPEGSDVFGELSVADNIALPTWTRKTETSPGQRLAAAYSVFPVLRNYLLRGGMQLSGGERKMVSIARAMALDPGLLLLDEAFEGLSPAILPTIREGLRRILDQGRSVLLAESNYHHLPAFADRLYIIERGEMVFEGTPAQARADAAAMKLIQGAA